METQEDVTVEFGVVSKGGSGTRVSAKGKPSSRPGPALPEGLPLALDLKTG